MASEEKKRLSDKQLKAIELLANGENKSTTAKLVNVNPKTIYAWLKIDMFNEELDKKVLEVKKQVEVRLSMQVEPLLDNLIKLALNSKDERISLQATTYALDRIYGKATTKQELKVETTDKTAQIENIDSILSDLDIDVIDVETKENTDK